MTATVDGTNGITAPLAVIIAGATSGQATISPPAVAGTPTLTLPTVSGTLLTNNDVSATPPIRQTVLSGPVDSSGFPSFGGSTGSTSITMAGTLIVTAANGFDTNGGVNRTGSGTNLVWSGLSSNITYILLAVVAADKTISTTNVASTNFTTQWGGTASVGASVYTFNIQEMKMYVGNGTSASQTYAVPVGEATVSGGVVNSITWYALMGRYISAWTATLPGAAAAISNNHNIGVSQLDSGMEWENTTTEFGYAVGDQLIVPSGNGGNGVLFAFIWQTYKSVGFTTQNAGSTVFNVFHKTTGVSNTATPANWKYRTWSKRKW